MSKTAPKLPAGYADVGAFLEEARERFEQGIDADKDNREAALDDLEFISGNQWDQTVKASRLKKGRPCLSINTLPQYVGQVIGDTRQNRPSIKIRPAEDGDKEVAEVRQGLTRFIENQSNASQVYAGAGESQVSCGIGQFRVSLRYSNDDTFDQDIRIESIPNPFAVVWDPLSIEPTGSDAEFCFVVEDVPRKKFEKDYPDALASDLTVPTGSGYSTWLTGDSVKVTEYWLMKEQKRTLALVLRPPETEPKIVDITDEPDTYAQFIVTDAQGQPRTREKVRRIACMYLITGRDILSGPHEYPISRMPIFKVTGREVQVGERRYRFGLVRFAKDPVRMKNLWRSSAAEWLALAPRQQWLLHAADKDEADRYRNAHKSGDTVLTYSGQIAPTRIDPPAAPNALLSEAAINDQDIKDTTGLHDASLGMKSNETSGKAILAREKQGDTATYMYHDNLNAAVRECGRVINDLIPMVFDTARTVIVLGEDGTSTPTRVNDPNGKDGLIDLKTGKYDVVVEVGPSYSTKRQEAAESMMAFVQAVPNAAQFVGDLIAQSQDWPMATEIAERLKKTLPAGLIEEDDGDLSPEEIQAKQQAKATADADQAKAREMALRGAELALDEQQAKVLQLDANARLAQAKAVEVEKGEPGEGEKPLEDALKVNQVRKAEAEAEDAEFKAQQSFLTVKKLQLEVIALGGDPTLPIETLGPDEARAAAAPPAPVEQTAATASALEPAE
jgi:hypothetical protein